MGDLEFREFFRGGMGDLEVSGIFPGGLNMNSPDEFDWLT